MLNLLFSFRAADDVWDGEEHADTIVVSIEKFLKKHNIDATACAQRSVCMSVRNANQNVAKGSGTSSDKILDGIAR